MQSLAHQFLTFCRSKPADEAYDFWSGSDDDDGCAVTQFVNFLGVDDPEHNLWMRIHGGKISNACSSEPYTFGALADRLEAALVEGE